jgi:protocatechuate 3,4-dioxygenase beta subunit
MIRRLDRRTDMPFRSSSGVQLSRRKALLAGVSVPWLIACGHDEAPARPPSRSNAGERGACAETEASIEGPYYRSGAPDRTDLTEPGMAGVPLTIEGRVSTIGCKTPLANVELDLWQANHAGHYDNDGSMPAGHLLLRGKVRTDDDGRYRVKTIVPGRYLNGNQYRPAHIHVKLRAAGYALLTTQLYFPDDPYNEIDPFIHRSLVMNVKRNDRVLAASYDFVLRPT